MQRRASTRIQAVARGRSTREALRKAAIPPRHLAVTLFLGSVPLTTWVLADEVPALLQDQADAQARQPPAPARPARPRTPLPHPNDDPAHLAHHAQPRAQLTFH